MQSFLLVLLGLAILGACIWILHRIQLRRTVENADLTAPLDALGESRLPDFAGVAAPPSAATATTVSVPAPVPEPLPVSHPVPDAAVEPAAPAAAELITSVPHLTSGFISGPLPATNDWLAQIRSLREDGDLKAALASSRAQFPKTQAFQQAAIILRQQIREALEQFQPVDALLRELYHTAALADLFRTSSSHKPHQPLAALAAVRTHDFAYADLGHARLKLLNKSDVRALEQLWGAPPVHRHTEDVLGEDWLKWCRAP